METPANKLDSLLKPASIALVGASIKTASPGRNLAELVINSDYQGAVYPVNPRYQEILGLPCYPDLAALPQTVDHVVLAVSNDRLEDALRNVVQHGAKAATIYASCTLENDIDPPLKQRLTQLAKAAGIAVCGGNAMGFYSVDCGLFAGIFPINKKVEPGSISYIAQSGSALSALVHNGTRLKFNLCVSCGNELTTSVSDYMDWCLEQSSTRIIALFLETIRNPAGFIKALQKAYDRQIPIVALKVGKSPLAAQMAKTHTGAMAGNHAAVEAVFKKYAVMEVADFDEMAALLILLQSSRKPGIGDLATIQESGGIMELVTDICHDLDIGFAPISDNTKTEIAQHLEPGLKADNPLDAWGTDQNFEYRFYACIAAMMRDPAVASGMFFGNFRDGYRLAEAFFRAVKKVSQENDKPLAMVNCYSDIAHLKLCKKSLDADIPFIDGAREALLATRHLYRYRDRLNRKPATSSFTVDSNKVRHWRRHLQMTENNYLTETKAMQILEDFDIAVPRSCAVDNLSSALECAQDIGYPVVLKSCAEGLHHKTERGGVVLDIHNTEALTQHYRDMKASLGPKVRVCEQIDSGTEIAFGMINDPQFGPFIMISAGGTHIELLRDRALALPPLNNTEADEMLSSVKVDKLLKGIRGRCPGNRSELIDSLVKLSHLTLALQDVIAELDINPIIVNPQRAIAVDALFVLNNHRQHATELKMSDGLGI